MHLEVGRHELEAGLKILAKLLPRAQKRQPRHRAPRVWREMPPAVITFKDGDIRIECGGTTVAATASGYWPGGLAVAPTFIASLARIPPVGDPVILTMKVPGMDIGHFGPSG